MSSICGSNIPPIEDGFNSLLKENWAWVDQRLEEIYYEYGLTTDNYDDYIDAGLLVERGAWVDEKLQRQIDIEFGDIVLSPAPMSWVLYNETPKQYCLEEKVESPRSRAESDISDHSDEVERVLKMINFQSDRPETINYSYLYAAADEADSVVSYPDEEFKNCSPISHCSEMTNLDINDPFYDFCSENRFNQYL